MKQPSGALIRLGALGLSLSAAVLSRADVLSFDIPQPITISEVGTPQVTVNSFAAPAITSLSSITIGIDHVWLGDLTVKLLPPAGPGFTLFDRVGLDDTDPLGSSAVLGNFVPNSDPLDPTFTLVPQPYEFGAAGADFSVAAQAAVNAQSLGVVPTNLLYAAKSWPTGPFVAGTWQLIITDWEDLSGGTLASVQAEYNPANSGSGSGSGSGSSSGSGLNWTTPADIVYGTPLSSAQLNATVLANGLNVPGTFSYSPPAGTVLPAGHGKVLSVSFTPTDQVHYSSASTNVTINVNPAPLSVTVNSQTMTYGGAVPPLTATYAGFVNGETVANLTRPVALATSATARSPAGTYPITATGGSGANYVINITPGTVTVTKALLSVTADAKSKAYGAALPTLTASYNGFVNGDTITSLTQPVAIATDASVQSYVGAYTIALNGGTSLNYQFALNPGILTVTQAVLTVTADNKSKGYGAALPALTVSYNGFVNGDTAIDQPVALRTTAAANSAPGVYPIVATGGTSTNYKLVLNNGQLTVTRAALIVMPDDKSKAYGATPPTLTVSYSGFVNGDTPASLTQPVTLATTAGVKSPVGSYPITATGGASTFYTMSFKSGSLMVTQALLTVTATNITKPYGAPVPKLTATYDGFANGDTAASLIVPVTLTTPATDKSPVGTYPVIVSGGASPNYRLAVNNGTVTVTKALLTVTADNKTNPYGAAPPTLTASYNGFINGDTATNLTAIPILTTTATPQSPVGTYPITVAGGSSPNYTLVSSNGTLTVTRAVLTVTVDDKSKPYGAPVPALTVSYGGFVNGDSVAILLQPVRLGTSASAASAAGQYAITAVGGLAVNYTLALKSGTLTVTPAQLTVQADDKTKAYGAGLPALSATYSGFVNGDTAASLTQPVSLATTATLASGVGTYPILVTGGASPNYSLIRNSGMLTVTKAALTVTAEDKSAVYGGVLPALTTAYDGFINGDTAAVLTQPVTLTTTAKPTSPAGKYPITVSGGASANYTLVPKSGVLSVVPAPLTILADSKTNLLGSALPSFTASYRGFVNGDTAASLTVAPHFATTANASSPAGTYPIIVNGAQAPNYAISFVSGTLIIIPQGTVPAFPQRALTIGADGTLSVSVNAPNGAQVHLQWSLDLETWEDLPPQASANGQTQFIAGRVGDSRLRFFRAVLNP